MSETNSTSKTRFERLKARLFDKEFFTKKEWWGENTTILDQPGVAEEPLIVRKALAVDYTLQNIPAELKPDELIVGVANMAMVGFGHLFPHYATDAELKAAKEIGLNERSVWGHHPPDYEKLLTKGVRGIRCEILEKMTQTGDEEKLSLYRAMLICLNALSRYADRYAGLLLKAIAEETDPLRRKELLSMYQVCTRVPENPATTFHEALQCHWFTYAAFHSCLEFVPIGRADQYLYAFYQKDLESGLITREWAEELCTSWLVKFSERVQINSSDWEDHYSFGDFSLGGKSWMSLDREAGSGPSDLRESSYTLASNHWLSNMILGGQDSDGNDATNELTFLILNCWAKLEVVSPVLSVRLHDNAPRKLFTRCAEILAAGSGEPALYNDEPIIQGLVNLGISLSDARNYANDGCWETLIPGKTDHAYWHIELVQMLEYVLFHGKSLVRGKVEASDVGDPCTFTSIEDVYDAVMRLIKEHVKKVLDNRIEYYGSLYGIAPDPLLSVLMSDCIQRGKDVTQGGAKYTIFTPILTGVANFCDSMAAIKQLVFEEKSLTMEHLIAALKNDFADEEPLRQTLLNRVPKFGNDNDYVDSFAIRILKDCSEVIKQAQKDIPWMLMPIAIGTFESFAVFGEKLGASADGRHFQETLSSNYSPVFGMDKEGPTASILSATKPNLLPYISGCPLDLQINSNEACGKEGIERLVGLIQSFRALGGIILTLNGVSEAEMRDAQVHPEKHKSLRVRFGGFSGYFIALPKKHQDIFINRIKHNI